MLFAIGSEKHRERDGVLTCIKGEQSEEEKYVPILCLCTDFMSYCLR